MENFKIERDNGASISFSGELIVKVSSSDTLRSMNEVVALIYAKEALKDRSRGKYKSKI